MGCDHLFYHYNPDPAILGYFTWGHAISNGPTFPLQCSQINSKVVWTGSATIPSDGNITMLYTGDTDDLVEVGNV